MRVGFVQTGEHVEWPAPSEPELRVLEMRCWRDIFEQMTDANRDSSVKKLEPNGAEPA